MPEPPHKNAKLSTLETLDSFQRGLDESSPEPDSTTTTSSELTELEDSEDDESGEEDEAQRGKILTPPPTLKQTSRRKWKSTGKVF